MDWLDSIDGTLETLRGLPFGRLNRIPLPKSGGIPFGHELRILGSFLRGRDACLDPSGLSGVYRRSLPSRERTLFDGLVARQPLPATAWVELLGDAAPDWQERGLLEVEADRLRSRFAVIPVGGCRFAVDPQQGQFRNKVHIGQDSLLLLSFVKTRIAEGERPRILDVGTGSGILLLGLTSGDAPGHGVDINPRAVRVARFNARLNGRPRCEVEECDVLDPSVTPGGGEGFDLVLWNAPFRFFPEEERAERVDGDGGELGIALTLAFLDRLPDLLRANGTAFVMSAAPITGAGGNALERELGARVSGLGLDVVVHPLQSFWDPARRAFLASHDIVRFESVILELRRGDGRCDYRPMPASRRLSGALRGVAQRGV